MVSQIEFFLMRFFHWTPEEFETIKNPPNGGVYLIEKNGYGNYLLKMPELCEYTNRYDHNLTVHGLARTWENYIKDESTN